MSLLFEDNTEGPKTHVLIIGVGGYPYLEGGAESKEQLYFSAQSLKQLSSPSISAEAFYNTTVALNSPTLPTDGSWLTPLGSVEVLVSPAPQSIPVFPGKQVAPATIYNINQAYKDWRKRCNTHAGNVAIFYFCGHGLDKGEHFLLAEDFGEEPENPWRGCFAFDMTRRAFSSCKAETQLFFVDACRELTSDMLTTQLPLNPIEPPSLLAKDCKFSLTQKAAVNESAYGEIGKVAFYTKALIGALTGNAADNPNNSWRVNTGNLATRMNSFIQMEAPGQGYAQRCISTTSDVVDIVHFNKPPRVQGTVGCNPDVALPLAELSWENIQTSDQDKRAPAADPWNFNIEAGIYRMKADFPGGPYKSGYILKNITPPTFSEKINCPQ